MTRRHAINLSSAWNPPRGGGPWLRRFGRPAGIETGDSLWLIVASPAGCGLAVNGISLPSVEPGGTLRQEVTSLLRVRNELALTGSADDGAALVPGASHGRGPLPKAIASVWLEIAVGPPAATGSP